MVKINFQKMEKKWQDRWEKKKVFEVKEGKKNKFYVLEMFPYPSGSGLHMGHALNYSIGDIYARFKRMRGYNVLYPMGYDSLGLPAENAAIKENKNPEKYTNNSIKNFDKQFKELGLSYDWTRSIKTHDPSYYKWDQWIFLKMFERGLAYQKESEVNWCPECQTVLANEQVINGKCWRHEKTTVKSKKLKQWFLKITDYAEQLYDKIDTLENWPERIKTMQKNWIQKKEWIDIDYQIADLDKKITVSTTRPDTNFGATFIVMAPEHPLLNETIIPNERRKEINNYIKETKNKTEEERIDEKGKKTGVFTGLYVINQLTNKKMPIWVADFVLMSVGTGIVVGVPGHDIRDFEFAKEYNLPILRVIVGEDGDKSVITKKEQVQDGEGIMFNSGFLNGLNIHKATKKIMDYLEEKGWGRRTIRYRLKDWLISRQRYWGTPIPIIYCDECGILPVPENQLPVKLPKRVKFGKGNPLETAESWIKAKCPKCGKVGRRETDTMDTFVNSSWYFLRYCDPKNKDKIFEKKKANYWCPINQYIGGAEHACLHLIYFRFYTKFLKDIGLINFDEPALRLFNQGMLHGEDGFVMSKSRGNVVLPEEVSKKYGIDIARLFLVSIASPDKDVQWSEKGIEGSYRFIKKLIEYFKKSEFKKSTKRLESELNKSIKEITEDIEKFRYNLAVIKLRGLLDVFTEEEFSKKNLESFLKLVSPFCPHIAEELWEKIGNKSFISLEKWPVVDESKIDEKIEKQEQIVENAINDVTNILKIIREKQGKEAEKIYLYTLPNEFDLYDEDLLSKRIGKKVKVFSVADQTRYDPEKKSEKTRIGKPGIFIE